MFPVELLQRRILKGIKNRRTARYIDLPEVHNIGFVFDINSENILEAIKRFVDILESKQIKFSGIAINSAKFSFPEGVVDYRIKIISRRHLSLLGVPNRQTILPFVAKEYDLFIDFVSKKNFTADYIARITNAGFKIGRISSDDTPYDLVLDNGEQGCPKSFLISLIHYLTTIRPV